MDVGVVGVGVMGKNHVRVYSELKKVDNLYVFDNDKRRILELAEMYDVVVCSSLTEILKKSEAVSICVPTCLHYEVAKEVVEKGINCLIEKPITAKFEEGVKLLEILAKHRDVIVGVGHIERFNPVIAETSNLLTHPHLIEIKRHNPSSRRITDVSVVEDLMIHDVDILFNVFLKNLDFDSYDVVARGNDNVCKVIIETGETLSVLSASRISLKKIRTIYIEDENATIDGDLMNQEIYVYRNPKIQDKGSGGYVQENIIEKVLVNKLEPLREELRTFIECVERGVEFPVTPQQAVQNLKICEKIRRMIE